MAVSGADVRARSRTRWPGCGLPWRVVLVSGPSGRIEGGESEGAVGGDILKRRRPGKKRRIVLRKRVAADKLKQELAGRIAAEKEEAEREKRTRRNREKKVKKKERDKAKKTMAKREGGGETGEAEAE